MLPEVIGAKKLLRLVALAKLVDVIQMLGSRFPIGWPRKLLTAIPTNVSYARMGWRYMEHSYIVLAQLRASGDAMQVTMNTRKGSTGPRMPTQVERILVPFSLILILETIGTVVTGVYGIILV